MNQDKVTAALEGDTLTLTIADGETLSEIDPDNTGSVYAESEFVKIDIVVDGETQEYWIDTTNPANIELEATDEKNAKTITVVVE